MPSMQERALHILGGAAKSVYQHYPRASKKGNEQFDDLISKCTSRELLTMDLIPKFGRQARNYMQTYKLLEIVGEGSKDQNDKKSNDITCTSRLKTCKQYYVVTVQYLNLTKDSLLLPCNQERILI